MPRSLSDFYIFPGLDAKACRSLLRAVQPEQFEDWALYAKLLIILCHSLLFM